ncbi:ABC transporter ATP-binding protein [Nitrincola alkalilacustris]|uniref:ABC transporter ATP-binding protein n=1 Tax=Nitrincola alkalilacustris TaxID=1571224 RepID=UPI00124C423B|nr:ABC transporter ATP-binding protein [Nitrincola alkalilacustris]
MAELILEQVSKRFGQSLAVNNLSLNIQQGAFVALLGPSGCGKTTTLRMLAGFETLSSGRILLNDTCLASDGWQVPTEDRNMGMVFQSYALWPHMSVADNVGYPLKHRRIKGGEYTRRVMLALETVQMEALAQRMPQDLSGGQRQRVALARCLVTDPDVVLLDEPLANLDRHLRASMEESFREFHRRTGATLIYVTHDQSEAMSLADQIAVMHQGQLVQWAKPEELYQTPKTQWIAGFIGQGSIIHLADVVPGQCLQASDLMALTARSGEQRTPVLIRPEHIRLHLDDNPHEKPSLLPPAAHSLQARTLPARVLSSFFRGERYEIKVQLINGDELTCYHHTGLTEGAQIHLTLEQGWSLEPAA